MARCAYCANQIPDDAPICPYCGATVAPAGPGARPAGPETPVAIGGPTLRGMAPVTGATAPATRAPAAPPPEEHDGVSRDTLPDPVPAAGSVPSPAPTPNVLLSPTMQHQVAQAAIAPRAAAPAAAAPAPAPPAAAPPAAVPPAAAAAAPRPAAAAPAPAASAPAGPGAPVTPASDGGFPGVRRTSPGGLLPGLAPAAKGGLSPRVMAANAARARSAAREEASAAAVRPPGTVTLKVSHLLLIAGALVVVIGAGFGVVVFGTDLLDRSSKVSADDRHDEDAPPKKKRKKPDEVTTARASGDTGPLFGKGPAESTTAAPVEPTAAPSTGAPSTAVATAAPAAGPPASLAGVRSVWEGGIASTEKYYRSTLRMELDGGTKGDIGVLVETESFSGAAEEIPAGSDRCEIVYRRPMDGTVSDTTVTYHTVAGRPASNSCKPGTELAADTRDDVTCRRSGDRLECSGTYKSTLRWLK
jgi:hypothetical protein